jgi:hypothetical protein
MGILAGCSDDHTRDFAVNFRENFHKKNFDWDLAGAQGECWGSPSSASILAFDAPLSW